MILDIIKGALIGAALIVPGLSGSIFAIMLGVYDKALGVLADFRREPKEALKYLTPIAIGVILGILGSAGIVVRLAERFPTFTYLFFVGLVIGSMPMIIGKTVKRSFKPKYLIGTVLAVVGVLILANMGESDNHISMHRMSGIWDFFRLLLSGGLTASLMIVPGVSGSVIIIVLGLFGTIYNAISQTLVFIQQFVSGNFEAAWQTFETVALLIPFGLGAILGLVSMAKIMNYLIQTFEVAVYYCVGGALLATIWLLGELAFIGNIPAGGLFSDFIFIILCILFTVLGLLSTFVIGSMGDK